MIADDLIRALSEHDTSLDVVMVDSSTGDSFIINSVEVCEHRGCLILEGDLV
jgi:hypothetical protein